jgi:hypothetical protein
MTIDDLAPGVGHDDGLPGPRISSGERVKVARRILLTDRSADVQRCQFDGAGLV